MGPDIALFTLLVLANMTLFGYLHVRRERRLREQRMMRSLRGAIERESGPRTLVLQPLI